MKTLGALPEDLLHGIALHFARDLTNLRVLIQTCRSFYNATRELLYGISTKSYPVKCTPTRSRSGAKRCRPPHPELSLVLSFPNMTSLTFNRSDHF
jgi:hypothetical protein